MFNRRHRPKSSPYRPKDILDEWGANAKCTRLSNGLYQVYFFVNDVPYAAYGKSAREAWHQGCLKWQAIPFEERKKELESR